MKPARAGARGRMAGGARTAAIAALVLGAVALWTGTASTQGRDGRIHLAVLRADGIMLPFASFDGRNWKTPWPQSLRYHDLPATVDDIPDSWWGGRPPGNWRVWSAGLSRPPRSLALRSTATFAVGQARRFGIRTDHARVAVPMPPFRLNFPKLGLAASGADVTPITAVSRRSPAWGQLLGSVSKAVDDAEERTIGNLRHYANWAHPYKRELRAKLQPVLETWYTLRFPDERLGVSYVEAVKKYPPGPKDDGCGLETIVSGWIHHEPRDAPPKTELRAVVTYCDRDRASFMLPLGQLEARGRPHWVFQMAGPDHEWYAVVELQPGRVRYVAQYEAGSLAAGF